MLLLFAGFFGIIQHSRTFAQVPVELNSENISTTYGCNPTSQNSYTCGMSSRGITSIAPDAFINLPNLRYLWLDDNQITSLEGVVRPTNIAFLNFGGNQITTIKP